MWMHGIVSAGKVLQVNHYHVINLGSQYGTQEAEPLGSRGQVAVGGVRILSEHGLLINATDASVAPSQEQESAAGIEVERKAVVTPKEISRINNHTVQKGTISSAVTVI